MRCAVIVLSTGRLEREHVSDVTRHLTHVDTGVASAGLCGETHLATGRVCVLPERHTGGCHFVDRDAALVVAQRAHAMSESGYVGSRPSVIDRRAGGAVG